MPRLLKSLKFISAFPEPAFPRHFICYSGSTLSFYQLILTLIFRIFISQSEKFTFLCCILSMEQARSTVQQLRTEANIHRKKVSEVAKDLVEFSETRKANDSLVTGHFEHNPFQEKKSCVVL